MLTTYDVVCPNTNVGKDDVVFPPHSPEPNHLSPTIDDIGLRNDSLGIIQVQISEVEDLPSIQVQLARSNDLYVELDQDFFTTDKIKTTGF